MKAVNSEDWRPSISKNENVAVGLAEGSQCPARYGCLLIIHERNHVKILFFHL
jgi:hypothetical protein